MIEAYITNYDELIAKAIIIATGVPGFCSVEEKFARLSIDGDAATLTWPEIASGYYNDTHIEAQTKAFPAKLLLLTTEQLTEWLAFEKIRYNNERAEQHRVITITAELNRVAQEKITYAALKQKYG